MVYCGIKSSVFVEQFIRQGKRVNTPSHQKAIKYKTYKAVVKLLMPGDTAIVCVMSDGALGFCLGYGEVSRTNEGWTEPRMLMGEY